MIWIKWDGVCLSKSTWLTECSALFCYYCYHYSSLWPSDAIWCQWCQSALVQVMAWCLFGTKPLPEPMMTYCQLEPREHFLWHLSQWMKLFFKENTSKCVICKMLAILFRPQGCNTTNQWKVHCHWPIYPCQCQPPLERLGIDDHGKYTKLKTVLKIRSICHAWDLWKLAWSCKHLYSSCPPDPWNSPGTAVEFRSSLKSTE